MTHNFVKEADYIVVGTGSAGCIIASRLAQAGESVIVIEAGPDTSLESTDPLFQIDKLNVFVPLLFPALWRRFQRVRCFTTYNYAFGDVLTRYFGCGRSKGVTCC